MLNDILSRILARDLRALRREIALYPTDDALWTLLPGIANSGGTLALHLVGNIQHFVGTVLGATGYIRDRESEFAARDLTREELLERIDQTEMVVQQTLERVDAARIAARYPLEVAGVGVRTDDWLVHLATHLAYHLGQVDYHRRIVTGIGTTAGAMRIPELATASREEASGARG